MKRIALPSLFVLLSVVLCLGRTVSDESTANAIKGVLRLQESLRDPASIQISRAIVTAKGICLEYQSRNGSGGMGTGYAVYKTDKDLVWVDNSWLWDQVCLVGKYGQRREGRDVTDAVNAAIEGKRASAFKAQLAPSAPRREGPTTPAVQLVVPASRVETLDLKPTAPAASVAPKVAVLGQTPRAAPLPSAIVTPAAAARAAVVSVAPVPTAPAPVPHTTAAVVSVGSPRPSPQAAVPARGGAQPKPTPVEGAAPSTRPNIVTPAAVASAELGTIRGVTIVDNNGALERKGPPPAPESLGDVARRLRHSKQQ
jgi:hypothetical protein